MHNSVEHCGGETRFFPIGFIISNILWLTEAVYPMYRGTVREREGTTAVTYATLEQDPAEVHGCAYGWVR